MAEPTITLDPDSRFTSDEAGRGGVQTWWVVASTEAEAVRLLAEDRGVGRGRPFRDGFGSPERGLAYRSIDGETASPPTWSGPGLWRVRARYGAPDRREREYPRFGRPVYRWGRGEETAPLELDLAGQPVENKRGEPFDPGLSKVLVSRTLTIQWVMRGRPNLPRLFAYDDAVNRDTWIIDGRWRVPPGQALCHGVDPGRGGDGDGGGGAIETQLSAEFEFRPGGELWRPYRVPSYTRQDGKRRYLNAAGEVVESGSEAYVHEFVTKRGAAFMDLEALIHGG